MVLVDKNLVGICGLYCGACIIYRTGKDSKKLQRVIADRENCGPDDIRCEGCQTALTNGWDVKGEEWGKKCKIVMCLEAKRLDFCYECSEYHECKNFVR